MKVDQINKIQNGKKHWNVKVSKYRKDISKFSFEPKNERKISALKIYFHGFEPHSTKYVFFSLQFQCLVICLIQINTKMY